MLTFHRRETRALNAFDSTTSWAVLFCGPLSDTATFAMDPPSYLGALACRPSRFVSPSVNGPPLAAGSDVGAEA